MSLIIKYFVLFTALIFLRTGEEYKYVLICTGHNCSPCVKTADDFFKRREINYLLINLYGYEADRQSTNDLIKNYCNTSHYLKLRTIKNNFKLGKLLFNYTDNGPFLIRYSKKDTLIYNPVNIDNIHNL